MEYRSDYVVSVRILGVQAGRINPEEIGAIQEMIIAPKLTMDSKKFAPEVVTQLRRLAHDLSNSIETIMQAAYLLGQTRLDASGKKWTGMIESAAQDAAKINQGLREILRNQGQRSTPRRRAS